MLRYEERERQTSSGSVERGKSEDMKVVRNEDDMSGLLAT